MRRIFTKQGYKSHKILLKKNKQIINNFGIYLSVLSKSMCINWIKPNINFTLLRLKWSLKLNKHIKFKSFLIFLLAVYKKSKGARMGKGKGKYKYFKTQLFMGQQILRSTLSFEKYLFSIVMLLCKRRLPIRSFFVSL